MPKEGALPITGEGLGREICVGEWTEIPENPGTYKLGAWTPGYQEIFNRIQRKDETYVQFIQMMGCSYDCGVDRIGGGGYGDVYDIGNEQVMKVIKKPIYPKREASFLWALNRRGIFPDITAAYSDSEYDVIVMKKLAGHSLQHFLFESKGKPAEIESLGGHPAKRTFLLELEQKIQDLIDKLHRLGVAHLDIKPGNIVVNVDIATGVIIEIYFVDGGSLDLFGTRHTSKKSPGTPGFCLVLDSKEYTTYKGWKEIFHPKRPLAEEVVAKGLLERSPSLSAPLVGPTMNDYSNLRLRDMIYALKQQFGVLKDPATGISDPPPAPISYNWAASRGMLARTLADLEARKSMLGRIIPDPKVQQRKLEQASQRQAQKSKRDTQARKAYKAKRSTLMGGKRSHTKRKKRSKTRKSR